MVFVANIVTVAEMQLMAGVGVGASDADANHTILQDHAEAYLSNLLKFNLTAANWALLTTGTKELISEWAARYAGVTMILNDMSGYTTRIEAEDMVNVHWARLQEIKQILEKADIQDFQGT
jgi:hypothetical protein